MGFGKREQFYGPLGSTRGSSLAQRIFGFALRSRPFFDRLSTKLSIRYLLKQTFGSYDTIPEGRLRYDYMSAHQPNAQHAPFTFISGLLFSADIDRIYEALRLPVWFAYGPHITAARVACARSLLLSNRRDPPLPQVLRHE